MLKLKNEPLQITVRLTFWADKQTITERPRLTV